ncbi:hypothetical protein BRD04_01690, partial [Halobacteriales archaeon QS_9_67_17]
ARGTVGPSLLASAGFVEREAGEAGLEWSRRHSRRASAPFSPTHRGYAVERRPVCLNPTDAVVPRGEEGEGKTIGEHLEP